MSTDTETAGDAEPAGEDAEPRKPRFALPSAYTILFALIVITALATWIIPAGQYALDADGSPIPGTYEEVESTPSRIIVDSLEAPINGLYGIEDPATGNVDVFNSGELFGAIDVALFILVIGGFIGITMKTGAIQAGIALLVARLRGHERWMIPILMTVFAIGGTTFGMAEESLAFYVLIITVMIAAGYDAFVGALVILLGCGIGVLGSTVNPFATGIASGFADVPLSDGLGLRLVILVVGLAVGIWFVLRYAERVRRDPSTSLVYDMKEDNERHFAATTDADTGDVVLTGQHKLVLGLFGAAFAVMIYGVIPWEDLGIGLPTLWWWFPEMTASFLLFAILIGVVARMKEGELTTTFVDGARDLLGVALIIGIARGITVVMNNGQITDTVLHWAEEALGDVGEGAFAVVMYLLFLPLSFLIPSTSGLATVAMPIMAPLADFAGVEREPRRHRLPERLRTAQPGHPDLGRRHGRARHRPRPLRQVPPLRVAPAHHPRPSCRSSSSRSGPCDGAGSVHRRTQRTREAADAAGEGGSRPHGVVQVGVRPEISPIPQDCDDMVDFTVGLFSGVGLQEVRAYETSDGSKAVCGHAQGPPGAPTVLLYFHHDVQPPLDEDAWLSPVWELTERDGRWYGRGTADCKGNIVTHLTALRALEGELPVSVKIVGEGSEELGDGGLEEFVPRHADLLRADVILICDTGNAAVGVPTLTTTLRGVVEVTVTVRSLSTAMHSGTGRRGGARRPRRADPHAGIDARRAGQHDDPGAGQHAGLARRHLSARASSARMPTCSTASTCSVTVSPT